MNTVSIVQWHPINNSIAAGHADVTINVDDATSFVRDAAVDYLTNNDPDVLFVHFDDVDHAGHSDGFSITVPAYKAAIETVDAGIGPIITAINNRPTIADEEWIVIITPDHGGLGTSHGGTSAEENNVFFIVSGDSVTNEELSPTPTTTNITGSKLSFDGSNDAVQIPNNTDYDFGSTVDFTIEAWIKTAGWSGDPIIVSDKDWDSGYNEGFVLAAYSDGETWKFNVGDGTAREDASGGVIGDNNWHHIAVSFDRSGQLSLFQDGILINQENTTISGDISSTLPLSFGWDNAYSDKFTGNIAEVRIWDAALDEAAIAAWSCQEITTAHPSYANLIGYWKMDEGTGINLTDSSPSGNNATASGGPSWSNSSGSLTCIDNSDTPGLADVMPTTLEHLCIPIDPAWNLDGTYRGIAACGACPPAGTACDDGNSSTLNDRFDGACNCIGNTSNQNMPTIPLNAKVFLEGAYEASALMHDKLRLASLLPSTEPYSSQGYTQHNSGNEIASSTALAIAGNDAIVDWVFLEVRAKNSPTTVLASSSALVQRDGDLVAADGVSPITFRGISPDNYYIAIHHRNHLSIMTASPIFLGAMDNTLDFTTATTPTWGNNARVDLGTGLLGLWSGDASRSNQVDAADRSETWNERNEEGYLQTDVNLDGVCDAADRSVAWNNRNRVGELPLP